MNANITKLDKLRSALELADQLIETVSDVSEFERFGSTPWLVDNLRQSRAEIYVELNKLELEKSKTNH